MSGMDNSRGRVMALVALPAAYLLFFFVLPIGIMAVFSFRAGTIGEARHIFTLDNYRNFVGNAILHRLLWRSVVTSFIISIVSVLLAYPLAYYLVFRAGERRVILLTLVIVPTWTSYLLRIFAWKLILSSDGLLNTFLLWAGLVQETSPILMYSREAVMLTLVYVWVPFVALPIFAALERIDRNLLEAAADLGCQPWEAFLRVTLPLSMPGVVAGFFFVFIPTIGEYVTPRLVGGRFIMYGNMIQDQFSFALNWAMGSVMSMAMLLAVIVFLFLLTRIVSLSDLAGL
jgi:spermidine/putrescine transport system permease protein